MRPWTYDERGTRLALEMACDAIRVQRAVSPDALMGRLTGHRLVKALEEDRKAERRR